MAFPSVTYNFENGSPSDGDQVDTNFNDLINGFSDGTKDMNMAAGTFGGNLTANGNVALGNGATDEINTTGRWVSDLLPLTTDTYDLGSSSLVWSEIRGTTGYYTDLDCSGTIDVDTINEKTSGDGVAVQGRTDGNVIAAGYMGEIKSSTVVTTTRSASVAATNTQASLTLEKGVWLVYAQAVHYLASRPSGGIVGFSVDLYNSSTATGIASATVLEEYYSSANAAESTNKLSTCMGTVNISNASDQVVYRLLQIDVSSGSGSWSMAARSGGIIQAIRIG